MSNNNNFSFAEMKMAEETIKDEIDLIDLKNDFVSKNSTIIYPCLDKEIYGTLGVGYFNRLLVDNKEAFEEDKEKLLKLFEDSLCGKRTNANAVDVYFKAIKMYKNDKDFDKYKEFYRIFVASVPEYGYDLGANGYVKVDQDTEKNIELNDDIKSL